MKLTVGLLVRNEADRYLKEVIDNISYFADEIIVLDDNSTDDTLEVIKETARVPVHTTTIRNGDFGNEILLRKMLYSLVLDRKPDWYMIIDADEIYTPAPGVTNDLRGWFRHLMNDKNIDVWGFRLYDMWNETHYRDDKLWRAHEFHSLMLVRNVSYFTPKWRETKHHCGRLPSNLWDLRTKGTEYIRIKHLGWMKDEDKQHKYDRYMKYDPDGEYGSLEHYESILDENPKLTEWKN